MSDKGGRPKSENPKCYRMEIRMDKETKDILESCAELLQVTKTDVIQQGIHLVNQKAKRNLNKKK